VVATLDRQRSVGGSILNDDTATRSSWSQVLARAIRGPLAGERLDFRPSTVATWSDRRRDHPDTEVLFPPRSGTM